ncbi:MAG: hypothetical protein ACRC35_11915 [Angustibacter sp.]
MLLRLLRGPRTGRPSLLARLVAALVAVGLLALSAPVLTPPALAAVRWLLSVL